jgi:hypothetical protein
LIFKKLEFVQDHPFDLGNLQDKENDLNASTKKFIGKEVKGEMGAMFTITPVQI